MKALIAKGNGVSEIEEVSLPEPGPREVRCRVVYSGICATDIAIITGKTTMVDRGWLKYPVRIGHEWSGVVEKVGSEVRDLKPGDRVVSETCWSCYDCPECWSGKQCTHARAIGTIGDHWPGCHADYMLMPAPAVHVLPESITLKSACMFEPASIAMDGLLKLDLTMGDTVLITGTGPIALTGVALAKKMGYKVFVTGRRDTKLAYAKKMGADVCINVKKESAGDVIARMTEHNRVDGILEATGDMDVLLECNLLTSGARISLAGFFERDIPQFDIDSFILRGNSLMGVAGRTGILPWMIKFIENTGISFEPLITAEFPFENAKDAVECVIRNNDDRIKVVLDHTASV